MYFIGVFEHVFTFIIIKVVYNHQIVIIVMQLSSYNKISQINFPPTYKRELQSLGNLISEVDYAEMIDYGPRSACDMYNSLTLYNYFIPFAMQQRQLSYEEANKLCEAALILICQQNTAKKQRSQKNKNSPFTSPIDFPLPSPTKTCLRDPKQQVLESPTIEHCLDFQKSPLKKLMLTPHKLSVDRQSSFMELLDLSQQPQFKLTEKEESCLDLASRIGTMSQKEIKIQTQISIESCQKLSQMLGEEQQKLFTQNQVKDLKRDLQIQSRGKICKTQNLDSQTGQIIGYHFLCKNDSDCPFDCFLEYTGKRSPKGQKIYRLISQNEVHLKACLQEEEQLTFMRLTKLIDSMEDSIRKLLSQDGELKPKDVLTKIAEELGESDHKFIYKGLGSKNYHKAAKKYFDNLIYKVKNPNWANS